MKYLQFLFLLLTAISCNEASTRKEKTNIEIAEEYIKNMEPLKAAPYLEKITLNEKGYTEAQQLLGTIKKVYSAKTRAKYFKNKANQEPKKWIPAEYLYYGIGVYFGQGEKKSFLGNVLDGYTQGGVQYVVFLKDSHREVKIKAFVTENANCFITKDDPRYQGKLLKYK